MNYNVCCEFDYVISDSGPFQWMSAGKTEASIYQQAEDGKTELSLMHFAITNPQWQPPRESTHFISQLKEKVHREATGGQQGAAPENHTFTSTHSLQSESEVSRFDNIPKHEAMFIEMVLYKH